MDDQYEADFNNKHAIESRNILCCAETGRVIAVFYNDYELEIAVKLLNQNQKVES